MANITVGTGYGYFLDADDNIVSKSELPPGKHKIKKGFTYVEVDSKEALDAIEVYISPQTNEEIREQKIQAEMRRIAEESLIARGEL